MRTKVIKKMMKAKTNQRKAMTKKKNMQKTQKKKTISKRTKTAALMNRRKTRKRKTINNPLAYPRKTRPNRALKSNRIKQRPLQLKSPHQWQDPPCPLVPPIHNHDTNLISSLTTHFSPLCLLCLPWAEHV